MRSAARASRRLPLLPGESGDHLDRLPEIATELNADVADAAVVAHRHHLRNSPSSARGCMGVLVAATLYIVARASADQLYRELTRASRAATLIRMTTKELDAFFDGWNRHDVDSLMTFMADDCVFETASGTEACGTRYVGRERVRAAFARVFASYPDAAFRDTRHMLAGDRGLSEWLFTGTAADGRKVEVNGCDVFTFERGKISVKSSFFKNRTA